jgi:hypothetical protein
VTSVNRSYVTVLVIFIGELLLLYFFQQYFS